MTMQETKPAKPTFGYYRRADGWITASPATDTDELRYRRDGWEPLRKYGKFEMSTPYMASNPLEPLFMRGGAGELPVEQILQLGLALHPPEVPGCGLALGQHHKHHDEPICGNTHRVQFPQLTGEPQSYSCPFGCGRELPTAEARDQHTAVMHAPEKSDQRTGEALAKALAEALLTGFSGKSPVEGAAVTAQVAELLASQQQAIEALRAELAAVKTMKAPKQRRVRRKAA